MATDYIRILVFRRNLSRVTQQLEHIFRVLDDFNPRNNLYISWSFALLFTVATKREKGGPPVKY